MIKTERGKLTITPRAVGKTTHLTKLYNNLKCSGNATYIVVPTVQRQSIFEKSVINVTEVERLLKSSNLVDYLLFDDWLDISASTRAGITKVIDFHLPKVTCIGVATATKLYDHEIIELSKSLTPKQRDLVTPVIDEPLLIEWHEIINDFFLRDGNVISNNNQPQNIRSLSRLDYMTQYLGMWLDE